MYRNHFSKKNVNFRTAKKEEKKNEKKEDGYTIKTHMSHISNLQVKKVDLKIEDNKKKVQLYLYDNLDIQDTGMPIDYVKSSEEADVASGFKDSMIIPLYKTEKGNMIQPHLDDLQNMFIWMLREGSLVLTDPSKDSDENVYELEIISETRTVIHKEVEEGESGEPPVWTSDISLIDQAMVNNDENSTEYKMNEYVGKMYEGYPIVWLGCYLPESENEYDSPCFIKCYLKTYTIKEYYKGYGSVDKDGIFVPEEEEIDGKRDSARAIMEEAEIPITNDEEPLYEIVIGKKICTNLESAENDYEPNFINIAGQDLTYINNIPGYRCELEYTDEEKQIGEIKVNPIVANPYFYLPNDNPKISTITINQNFERGYSAQVIIADLSNVSKAVDIVAKPYVIFNSDVEVKYSISKPVLRILYDNITKDDYYEPKEGESVYLKKEKCNEICSKIRQIEGFTIGGEINVINEEGSYQMKYLRNIVFKNCSLIDDTENKKYLWLYNCNFVDCDNQMIYYKEYIDKDEQIIGEEIEEKLIRKAENLGAVIKPDGENSDYICFVSDEDLYSYLNYVKLVAIKNFNVSGYKILQVKSSNLYKDCYLFRIRYTRLIETNGNVSTLEGYYQYNPSTKKLDLSDFERVEGKELLYIVMKKVNLISNEIGYFQPHLCYATDRNNADYIVENSIGVDSYYKDIYYGILGSEETATLKSIFEGVNKVTNSLVKPDDTTENTEIQSVITHINSSSVTLKQIQDYLKQLRAKIDIMPINMDFIGELEYIASRIAWFEKVRLPSCYTSGNKVEGLDKKHQSEISQVTDDDGETISYPNDKTVPLIEYSLEKGENKWKDLPVFAGSNTYELDKIDHKTLNEFNSIHIAQLEWLLKSIVGTNELTVEEEVRKILLKMIDDEMLYYSDATVSGKLSPDFTLMEGTTLEIYEPERVYKVYYGSTETKEYKIRGSNYKLNIVKEMTLGDSKNLSVEEFIVKFLNIIKGDLEEYLGEEYEQGITLNRFTTEDVDEFAGFIEPKKSSEEEGNPTIDIQNRNALIEYSQMLETIQSERDLISKKGKQQFVVKYQQTTKGTIFEILKAEGMNYLDLERVVGYYISIGYGSTGSQIIKEIVPEKPKGRKIQRGQHKNDKEIIPSESMDTRYRITRMPEYYYQEPLDWRNDNYFSNQIYTLNADNLNTIIDPEFADRIEVIESTEEKDGKILKEQDMIGFYIINYNLEPIGN